MKTTKQILLDAADIIEENEWCQGALHYKRNEKLHYCAVGALQKAANLLLADDGAVGEHVAYLETAALVASHVGKRIDVWNDDEERTAKEVIYTLREVADVLE
jgi:hypothetical protein